MEERERENLELDYLRIEILGICLFLQSVIANLHANDKKHDNSKNIDYHNNNDEDDNDNIMVTRRERETLLLSGWVYMVSMIKDTLKASLFRRKGPTAVDDETRLLNLHFFWSVRLSCTSVMILCVQLFGRFSIITTTDGQAFR